jgi:hypothetical protein
MTHEASSSHLPPATRVSSGPQPPRNARPAGATPLQPAEAAHPSAGDTAADAAPAALGALTEALHADLVGRWPSRYCHRDPNAFVLHAVPSSEDRQKKLVRATIESARRFAIVTSYIINPAKDHVPGRVSGTTFAMLEALARKQRDPDFTFVLLYNRNKLQENGAIAALLSQNVTANMSLKSRTYVPGTTTWPAVIHAYNREQRDEGLRLGRIQCRILFVAAKAKGLAGSHHNKFCINDQGLAATLGASVANKTKDDWMDGGCITVSASLAASQRDYFLDELMDGHDVQCARLRMDGEKPAMEPVGDPASIRALLDGPVRSPLDLNGAGTDAAAARFRAALSGAGVPLAGHRRDVLWIQNPSDGCRNMFSMAGRIDGKPIGRAFATVLRSAVAGEAIDIVGKKVGTESFSLIAEALRKGCNVNLLVDHSSRMWVEYLARRLYADRQSMPPGRLTIRHYAPNEHLVRQQSLSTRQRQVLHAKNYVLTRHDGSCVVMTGSYNLDGQSHYRSNENLMVFEAPDTQFRRLLFDELHEASDSPVSRYPAPREHSSLSAGCWTRLRPGRGMRRT